MIGDYAFYYCSNLTTVSFPACTTIGSYAFYYCSNLTTASFPACTTINYRAFKDCYNLTTASFPACTMIGDYAFDYCSRLSQLYLTAPSVCKLSKSNAFSSTPYAGYSTYFSGTPYIYVPASLLTSYQTATNWTYFSKYFSAFEDAT
jgi:predicted RNA-binding protein with PUA-like domain